MIENSNEVEKIIGTPKKIKEYRKALFTSCLLTPEDKSRIEKASTTLAELFVYQIDSIKTQVVLN